jgi:5-(carboxyamino)imidazole ribonucleotide synthase
MSFDKPVRTNRKACLPPLKKSATKNTLPDYLCAMSTLNRTIGILGGGQLGRMFLQESYNYNARVRVLDPTGDAPCAPIATEFVQGSFNDYRTVLDFGRTCDIITIEFEHVNTEALHQLEKEGKKVYPQPHILELIKDKGAQKAFYTGHGIPTGPYFLAENADEVRQKTTQLPVFQKLRKGGYDGYGVKAIRTEEDLAGAFDAPSLVEEWVDFEKELSVITARNENGETAVYPAVEMVFHPVANMVEFLASPAQIPADTEKKAQEIARQVIEALGMVGILAVEMFLTKTGEIWVNEVAPRPHNSGHQTIEGNYCSQYEMHFRSIMNLPLGCTDIVQPSVMVNLLGDPAHSGPALYEGLEEVMQIPGVYVHLYGKTHTKPYRKMGHVTILDSDAARAMEKAKKVKATLRVVA